MSYNAHAPPNTLMTFIHPWYTQQQRQASITTCESKSEQKPQQAQIGQKPTKFCGTCDQHLTLDQFTSNRSTRDKLSFECRSCRSETRKLTTKLKKQHPNPGVCACCGTTEGTMHIDHDHSTGAFRGWLCNKCNQGIGLLGDDIAGLRQPLNYLTNVQQEKQD